MGRLDETQLRILEEPDQAREEIGCREIVGIDHRDQLGLRIHAFDAEIQGACLGAGERRDVEKAEPVGLAVQPRAIRFNRAPQRFIRGVVVTHQHLEIGIVETRKPIERRDHHLGRLGIAGQMDRDLWQHAAGAGKGSVRPAPDGMRQQRLTREPLREMEAEHYRCNADATQRKRHEPCRHAAVLKEEIGPEHPGKEGKR